MVLRHKDDFKFNCISYVMENETRSFICDQKFASVEVSFFARHVFR